jgi:hypothetical protein
MSWLGRIFGGTPPPPPPPANSVLIAEDLVEPLTAGGAALEEAANTAIRSHIEAQRRAAEAEKRGEKIPFWLRRDDEAGEGMEDELRDRVIQRRASEDER